MRILSMLLLTALAGCATVPPPLEVPLTAEEQPYLSDAYQLTSGFGRAGEAYFSPDMNWIIFQAAPTADTGYQMYVAPLEKRDGRIVGINRAVQVSEAGSKNTCGYFEPYANGASAAPSLIFGSTGDYLRPLPTDASRVELSTPVAATTRPARGYAWEFPTDMEIWRLDNWPAVVRPTSTVPGTWRWVRLTNNNVYDAEGAFSPDGKWIVYTSGAGAEADIYIMSADGQKRIQVTKAPGYDGGPFFSPDGRRLVYRSDRKLNDTLQIFVADLAFDAAGNITGVKAERQITHDDSNNWAPYWHPAGKHIIYASSRHGHRNYELYLIGADGSNPTRITYWEGSDVLPVFSPDGQYLMWTSRRARSGTPQVVIARVRLP